MKKFAIWLILLFGVLGNQLSASNYEIINQLTLPADKSHSGSLISWGGTIKIHGNLKGSVILIGGRLEVNGRVDEDVICVGTYIEINKTALVKGDLLVIGGKLNRHPQSIVGGEFFNSKFDLKKIETTLMPLLSDSNTLEFFMAVKIILWLIISLVVFAVVPKKVIDAESIIGKHALKVGAIGIFSLITFLFFMVMFIIMSFFIIGLPLLLGLVLFYFAVYLFGRTVMFYFIGDFLSKRFKFKQVSSALFIVIGAIVYAVLKLIPVLGTVILIIVNILEVGIGISFMFRKRFHLEH